MIELGKDVLVFTFPEVHPEAKLTIECQRTLRIPDDDTVHFLPPGLDRFPLRHVDDFAETVPARWIEHGGVMFPMYQSEAMWLNFRPHFVFDHRTSYPFAVKVAAGKIDAVTGKQWTNTLHASPQDYLVIPDQPWLDGFCVEKGVIRQFVAMPLNAGYTAEEQITGTAEHGGLQIIVYPMKRSVFERRFPKRPPVQEPVMFESKTMAGPKLMMKMDMGLAPGGRMRQEICEDPYGHGDWYRKTSSRCFVHIANSLVWRAVTGEAPPTIPPTAKQYSDAGLPWFDYYDEIVDALDGSNVLENLKSVIQMGREKGEHPLPENEAATPKRVIRIRRGRKANVVREGTF
jgi:hypothetical protein